jgi:hypothetical protein
MIVGNEEIKKNTFRKIIILIFLWSLIVLPCCWFGYGSDEDAWAVGEEGAVTWETGKYSISRSTGFPLHELVSAVLSHYGGWFASNFFSYLCGLALAYFMALLIKENHFKNPIWVFAGVMFLPQVIINSSSTIDYMPSLALFGGAYYFFTKKKYYLMAVMVGVSCGFRPSNGAFIIPLILAQLMENKDYKLALKVFLLALVIGIVCYLPVLINYGIRSPTREVDVPFIQYYLIGGYQALILFGIWQSIVMGGLFLYYYSSMIRNYKESIYVRFHVLNIVLWVSFFIFVTCSEAEYLFPILFSVIFLADAVFDKKHFKILVLMLVSYNLFSLEMLGGESGNRKIVPRLELGFTIRDMEDRLYKQWYREATTSFHCKNKTLIMYGSMYVKANNDQWEYSPIAKGVIKQKEGNLYLSERILDEKVLKKMQDEGFEIYVWNSRKWEYITLKLDFWTKYVKIIYDLEGFLGSKKYGRLMQ